MGSRLQAPPPSGTPCDERPHDRVMHELQARVAADHDLCGRHVEQLGKEGLHLGKTVQAAIVAGVGAVGRQKFPWSKVRQETVRQIELLGRRLTPRHVELEPFGLERLVAGDEIGLERREASRRKCCEM